MHDLMTVIQCLKDRGVQLWSVGGNLHFRAPKGVLTDLELNELRRCRREIVELLGAESPIAARGGSRPQERVADLAYSQVAHWNAYRLFERASLRQVASATRTRGHLDIPSLQVAVEELAQRHPALRTRMVVIDNDPFQEILHTIRVSVDVCDLTTVSETAAHEEVRRLIDQFILKPIKVTEDPLFGFLLVRMHRDDVLILAAEHMISDWMSLNILLRDLFALYARALTDCRICLPAKGLEFVDYSILQRSVGESWSLRHQDWCMRLIGCGRLSFPDDASTDLCRPTGWGIASLRIDQHLRMELDSWRRVNRTTLTMVFFSAFAALVLRWCGKTKSVIQFQSDGRVAPEIENTVGYFAHPLYIVVSLLESDTFTDMIRRSVDEYCTALENRDFSYLAAQSPRPEFTRSSLFNWMPVRSNSGFPGSKELEGRIDYEPVHFSHPMLRNLELDQEPIILLYDDNQEIRIELMFPLRRFRLETMQVFLENLRSFLTILIGSVDKSVMEFPLRRLN